jgi:hypothetical protein
MSGQSSYGPLGEFGHICFGYKLEENMMRARGQYCFIFCSPTTSRRDNIPEFNLIERYPLFQRKNHSRFGGQDL